MHLKHLLTLLVFAAFSIGSIHAQSVGIKGQVVDQSSNEPISMAKITFTGESQKTIESDLRGFFQVKGLPQGKYKIIVAKTGYVPQVIDQDLLADTDLGVIVLVATNTAITSSLSDMTVADLEMDNDMDVQEMATLLSSSQDTYNNIASYTFSPMRFRVRGYDSEYSDIYLNGVQMNDMNSGYGVWSLWGGLNDATRNQENAFGMETLNLGFGNLGGIGNIDTRASGFRPGVRLTYSLSNRTYSNRLMATYATGIMDNGWSLAASVSRRWGDNAYVDGVFYDAWGAFFSAEKRINTAHSLALTALVAPTKRGVASGATQEAYDLTNTNYYNPNIGYQDGKLRNARVRDNFEPVIVLNHYWNINDKGQTNFFCRSAFW